MSQDYAGVQVVGIDLHRRRTVIVRKDAQTGEQLGSAVQISNRPDRLVAEVGKAGSNPRVVLEATYGWYWAADALQQMGADVHLAHPLGNAGFRNRRVKNDEKDAGDLADLLRLGRLAEAWIAPPQLRELRELVRYRQKLVNTRTSCKNQVHAVLAKCGVTVSLSDIFGPTGARQLDALRLPTTYADRIGSLRRLIDTLDVEIDTYDHQIAAALRDDPGYVAIQTIPGVGPVLAAVFVAEIGDVGRFSSAAKLCCWAGLTPRHRESDHSVHRGSITKQGSKLVRWAAVEAVQRQQEDTAAGRTRSRVGARRGKGRGNIAAARTLLTHVYYGLRDHEIRALAEAGR